MFGEKCMIEIDDTASYLDSSVEASGVEIFKVATERGIALQSTRLKR